MHPRTKIFAVRNTENDHRLTMSVGTIAASIMLVLFSMPGAQGQSFPGYVDIGNYVHDVYRKPTKKELETVKLAPEILAKSAEFLKRPHTGLFRFLPDSGCYESQEIVNANENCTTITIPGNGTSFSFRMENYRARRFADLSLSGNNFVATGIFAHGILVNLGDLPIESVNAATPGMGYIVNFEPVTDLAAAREIGAMLTKGVEKNGFRYGQTTPIVNNATYALRSVAYRGRTFRSTRGVVFNEVGFDRRADVIIIFKVVDKAADGSISILWEEFSRKEAPRIKDSK